MPYVDLPGEVSLYCEFPRGPIDPLKPTLVCLSPMHSITLLGPMLAHPFWANWNVVIFDLRFHGRGSSPQADEAYVDFGVHAADVAFGMEKLSIPAAHFYCPAVSAFHTGVHLSVLFPQVVLSLSFAGVYRLFTSNMAASKVFIEIDSYIVDAETQEEFIDGVSGLAESCLGSLDAVPPEVMDRVCSEYAFKHDPRTIRSFAHHAPFRIPFRLRPEHLEKVTVPVLVMHGERDVAHSREAPEEVYAAFTSSVDRRLWIVPGAPHVVDLTHEPQVTSKVVEFLGAHSTVAPAPVVLDRERSMALLADITGDRSVLSRDPTLAVSYYSQSPETLARQKASFAEAYKRAAAYDGPIFADFSRPWEERRLGEWSFTRRHDAHELGGEKKRASVEQVAVHLGITTIDH